MNNDDFTDHELDSVCELTFNLSPSEIQKDLELMSIPVLRYLLKRCDEIIAQQHEIKTAAKRRLQELED